MDSLAAAPPPPCGGNGIPKLQAPNIKQFSTLQFEILNLFGIWDLKLGFSASKRRQGRAYPEVTPAILPSSLTRVLPKHLRLLASTTCVGCRYGYHFLNHGIFWSEYSSEFRILLQFYFQAHTWLNRYSQKSARIYARRHHGNVVVVQEYQPVVHRLRFSASA